VHLNIVEVRKPEIDATLVAEGIEREEERDALIGLGVEYGQGYFLGRPSFQVSARAFAGA